MNKEYFQAMANAADCQARSLDFEAEAARIEGNQSRYELYLSLAASSRINSSTYQGFADEYDKG